MRVAIVNSVRTPFVKAQGVFSRYTTTDLGIHVLSELFRRSKIDPGTIDELIFGSVLHNPHVPHVAREIVLRSGLPKNMVAHTVSNNCITGLSAFCWGADAILSKRVSQVVVGGAESMSNPSITISDAAQNLLLDLNRTKGTASRLKKLLEVRLKHLKPKLPSPSEPSTGLTMGEHCELMAKSFQISRADQDQVAFESHKRASLGYKKSILQDEIVSLGGIESDNIIREDTSLERLSMLKPVFDKTGLGTITAGNSSALTDGASAVLLMSEELAHKTGVEPLAFLEGIEFSALPLGDGLLMAPGLALPRLTKRLGLSVDQIDRFEIHEAFAAQVLANMKVWKDGWRSYPENPIVGEIPVEKMNVYGGSLALGHPFAATGGRMLGTLARELKRHSLRRGIISVCAAGGMACAISLVRD